MRFRAAMIPLALFAFAALAAVSAPASAQDPAVVGPNVYKPVLDNERMRILEVTFERGVEMPMHSHPDHAAYVVEGGRLRITAKDGKVTDLDLKPGDAIFIPAESHSAKNIGKKRLRVVVTELKEGADSATLSSSERAEILDLLERSRRELEELVAKTPDELWAKKPAPDRWSVSEVVEHLSLTEPLLFGLGQQSLAAPADANWASVEGGISTDAFVGQMTDRSQKFNAPEPAQPKGGMSRADALARYGGARIVTEEFVRRTDAAVKKHVATMPFGKMTVHQLLVMIGAHNLRHNQQIAETLAQVSK